MIRNDTDNLKGLVCTALKCIRTIKFLNENFTLQTYISIHNDSVITDIYFVYGCYIARLIYEIRDLAIRELGFDKSLFDNNKLLYKNVWDMSLYTGHTCVRNQRTYSVTCEDMRDCLVDLIKIIIPDYLNDINANDLKLKGEAAEELLLIRQNKI